MLSCLVSPDYLGAEEPQHVVRRGRDRHDLVEVDRVGRVGQVQRFAHKVVFTVESLFQTLQQPVSMDLTVF